MPRQKPRSEGDFLIRFDFPDVSGPVYAGWAGDVLGFAMSTATAANFAEEAARNWIKNNFSASQEFATIVKRSEEEARRA